MSEERTRILTMLAAGKITAVEAEQLLDALGCGMETADKPAPAKRAPKYLRVTVDTPEGQDGGNPEKVNIRVPIQLLRAGMKFATLIPQQAQAQIDQALHDKGLQFNLKDLTPEMIDNLIADLGELVIDANDSKGSKVRVYCE